jgi:RNA-directed DNA polymerase
MGIFDFFKAKKSNPAQEPVDSAQLGLAELFRRLGILAPQLQSITTDYQEFTLPKRSGGQRTIHAPNPKLKEIQRTILIRLLARLKSHPNVTGFEKRHSIVTNAKVHQGSTVILRMDIQEFFPATSANRVLAYFRAIGWDTKTAKLLTALCTYKGSIPQGAPTSPRLSNLVNYEMDARLNGLAKRANAAYTRYADDITFSFTEDSHENICLTIRMTKKILSEYGYRIHHKKKLHIRRKHQCQQVTGLVVNEKVSLPRRTRRWLRAVKHHLTTGRPASLTPQQLTGWQALQYMIETQSK